MANPEFVTKLKNAIEAAFKKDPAFEKRKIEFREGETEHVTKLKSENIVVCIGESKITMPDTQYVIHTYVPEYQLSAAIYISEAISEKIEEVMVSSDWRPDIHGNLVITVVTK